MHVHEFGKIGESYHLYLPNKDALKHQEGRQYYLSTKNLFGVQSVTKKSSVISQNHQQGGLKIIEMNKYIISLKCSLLKGLFNGKKKIKHIYF